MSSPRPRCVHKSPAAASSWTPPGPLQMTASTPALSAQSHPLSAQAATFAPVSYTHLTLPTILLV
eukprot:7975826-Pyramimonas_sp.AAC.1